MHNPIPLRIVPLLLSFVLASCSFEAGPAIPASDTAVKLQAAPVKEAAFADSPVTDHVPDAPDTLPSVAIQTGATQPQSVVDFAQTLLGTPYVWASTDPSVGFDCSGFITYVFRHFNIDVPRSSSEFINVGKTIEPAVARPGDLVLFTGTNPLERNIGHMGIVISNDAGALRFIHASSGRAMAVTISPLDERYWKRFVRVARVWR